ncbi:MAG TPA: hypothetical protein VFP06_17160 [Acidimicrobiales bacterium]|nr:hypothetical protein [Acidimicrobiales bacterium]
MTEILTAVTEAEAKVVDAVRDLQEPVVGYLQKGVDFASERLPAVTYPENLPQPGEVIDSQYEFLTSLLAAQYDLVKAVTATVAPLVGAKATPARAAKPATKASKATKAAAAA